MVIRNLKKSLEFVYIILWVALGAIHFFLLHNIYGINAIAAFADSFVFNALFMVIGSGLWFMVRFSDLQSRRFGELAFFHLTGAVVTILAWLGLGYLILSNIMTADLDYLAFLRDTLTIRGITGVMFYSLLVTIYYLLINYRELKEKSRREAELTGLLKEAELNMLRSQIRPHFLFNSLNSISSLTMTDPEKAQEMVIKLSEFMRYSLNFPDTMMSTLEKELYHAGLYLDIEKVRFGERLVFEKNVAPEAKAWDVPVMILQPLIENSVKHGVYESAEATIIRLDALLDGEVLEIRIGNTYDPEAKVKKGTGTGLRNIRERLLNIYGTSTLLKIDQRKDYFEVTLRIPRYAR
ncbi:MAG: histidine kinase [Bacteroidales bacterium]|nr:histidine kinase [Bacteroidales bacterium]